MSLIQILTYVALLIAAIAILAKLLKYARAPLSMRWELYPVPHEKGRADYGGSYLEELDWWTKPRHSDMVRELKEMLEEIIFLKGVYHNNKKVWLFSFPFHFGMYLAIGWLALLLAGAIFNAAGVQVTADAGFFGMLIYHLTGLTGYIGLVLTGLGALGLFFWRISDTNQRPYNSFVEYFNLLLIDLVIIVALIAHITADPAFNLTRAYVQSLITFSPYTIPSGMLQFEFALVSILILYIPISRMSHFVAKYFLYHSVRWNDEPTTAGSKIEKSIMEMLAKKVTWGGKHIQTGKTWAEIVQEAKNEK